MSFEVYRFIYLGGRETDTHRGREEGRGREEPERNERERREKGRERVHTSSHLLVLNSLKHQELHQSVSHAGGRSPATRALTAAS